MARTVEARCKLGHLLEEARLDRGMHASEVARRVGISRTYWYDLLAGRYSPSKTLLIAFAAVLRLDADMLDTVVNGPANQPEMWSGLTKQDAKSVGYQPVVYLLFQDRELIYIGCTSHLRTRLKYHEPKDYTGWIAYRCASRDAALVRERKMLETHQPPLNDLHHWQNAGRPRPWSGPYPVAPSPREDTEQE